MPDMGGSHSNTRDGCSLLGHSTPSAQGPGGDSCELVHARELRRAHTGKCAHCPARLSPDACCCPLPKGFLLSPITHCHGLSLMTRGSCATRMAFVPLSFSSALRIIAHETRWPASRRGQGRVGRSRMQVIEGQSNGYRLGATKALAAIVTRGVHRRASENVRWPHREQGRRRRVALEDGARRGLSVWALVSFSFLSVRSVGAREGRDVTQAGRTQSPTGWIAH